MNFRVTRVFLTRRTSQPPLLLPTAAYALSRHIWLLVVLLPLLPLNSHLPALSAL
jgi:hypothetical protein